MFDEDRPGCFGIISGLIGGIIAACILLGMAAGGIAYNEHFAKQMADENARLRSEVVEIGADRVDAANEGALVRVVAPVTVEGTREDPDFGVTGEGMSLTRRVAMYQWMQKVKTKTRGSGATRTEQKTYSYEEMWTEELLDSSGFYDADYVNPPQMPLGRYGDVVTEVKVGAFGAEVDPFLELGTSRWVEPDEETLKNAPAVVRDRGGELHAHFVFFGEGTPKEPKVGDARVSFELEEPPSKVTVLAAQQGNRLVSWRAEGISAPVFRVFEGNVGVDRIFEMAEEDRSQTLWIFRAVTCFGIFLGLMIFFSSFASVFDWIPIIRTLASTGAFFLAVILTVPMWYGLFLLTSLVMGTEASLGFGGF